MQELGRMSTAQFKEADKYPLCVILDNVRSMHNIGSCFRTCDAFRVEKLCLCGITAVPPHREIEKAALGATLSVDWQHYEDTLQAVAELKAKGYKVYAVEQVENSTPLQDFAIQAGEKTAFVFGNEVESGRKLWMPATGLWKSRSSAPSIRSIFPSRPASCSGKHSKPI